MIKYNIKKLVGVCGILVPIIIFLCIWLSISGSPWFSWTHHALSDLGIQGLPALIFNNGIILGGIFAFIFSIGLSKILSYKLGAYLLAISSLALIGAGIFPKTLFLLHYVSSTIFFVALTLALLIIGYTLKETKFEHKLGIAAIFFAIVACSSPLFLNILKGIAIPEAIVCFPAFIWCMVFGVKIILNEKFEKAL